MKKLNFPGGKSFRLSRVCVSGSVQAAVKERRRGHRRAPSGQPAVAPVSSRAAQLGLALLKSHLRSLLRPLLEAPPLRSDGSGRPAPRSPRQYLNPPFLGRFAAVAGVGPVPPSPAPASLAYTYNQ